MRKSIIGLVVLCCILTAPGFSEAMNADVASNEALRLQARPLPLSAVRLLDGPLKHAQDLDAAYLLELEPDRMLALFRERAGLEPKAEPYGGWDGDGRNLTGHVAGHYLSAISLMYAATGNKEFKDRATYIVTELKEVQDKHGDGFLSAQEGARECFVAVAHGDIKSDGFDLNGLWVPWYTLHKLFAGLRDAYRYTDNEVAQEIEISLATWVEEVLKDLTNDQLQKMLNAEFGGMNEVLIDLYADTNDRRWLDLSYKFEHEAILEPLKRHQDILPGKHGNTQIPKMVGSVDRFAYVGQAEDIIAASFFWDRVVQHHSWATGGHGLDEHFGEPDKLNDRVDGRTSETCNVYNMLKLTRRLFALRPDAHYAEFQERALFNHILASIDPEDGRTCYMVPVGRGVSHEYSDMFRSFTCCVGSGMESHALHGDGIYYESDDTFWVNLYTASQVNWDDADAIFTMETEFPIGDTASFKMKLETPREFTLALRRPTWTGDGFALRINGESVDATPSANGYVEITRSWKNGDKVQIALPKSLRLESLPDNENRAAVMWGPLVLAGDIGPEMPRRFGRAPASEPLEIPVFVVEDGPVENWLTQVPDEPGHYQYQNVQTTTEIALMPFYQLHRRAYSVYWDFYSPVEWEAEQAAYAAAMEKQRKLEAATVAYVQPGEMQPERDYNFQGENTRPARQQGRAGRRITSWFSFDIPVEPEHPMVLYLTLNSAGRQTGTFKVLVDNQVVQEVNSGDNTSQEFFDVTCLIPTNLVEGKEHVTVKFQAIEGRGTATLYGIRMVREDPDIER